MPGVYIVVLLNCQVVLYCTHKMIRYIIDHMLVHSSLFYDTVIQIHYTLRTKHSNRRLK